MAGAGSSVQSVVANGRCNHVLSLGLRIKNNLAGDVLCHQLLRIVGYCSIIDMFFVLAVC